MIIHTSPVQICPITELKKIDKELFNTVYAIMPGEVNIIPKSKNNTNYTPTDRVFIITMKEAIALHKLQLTTYDIVGIFIKPEAIINLN